MALGDTTNYALFIHSAIIKESLIMLCILAAAEQIEIAGGTDERVDLLGQKMLLMGVSYIFEDWIQSSCQYFYF